MPKQVSLQQVSPKRVVQRRIVEIAVRAVIKVTERRKVIHVLSNGIGGRFFEMLRMMNKKASFRIMYHEPVLVYFNDMDGFVGSVESRTYVYVSSDDVSEEAFDQLTLKSAIRATLGHLSTSAYRKICGDVIAREAFVMACEFLYGKGFKDMTETNQRSAVGASIPYFYDYLTKEVYYGTYVNSYYSVTNAYITGLDNRIHNFLVDYPY